MSLVTSSNLLTLWQEVIKFAEGRCSIALEEDIESYLVSLLIRYTNKPEVVKQIFATNFLEAMHQQDNYRDISLQHVGDGCLLVAGLFPKLAEKRYVKIRYFVDLGRSAYANISKNTNDVYESLALQFVVLMDVLQSIRETPSLLPLEAYEQWNELGSQRALKILQEYTSSLPLRRHIR